MHACSNQLRTCAHPLAPTIHTCALLHEPHGPAGKGRRFTAPSLHGGRDASRGAPALAAVLLPKPAGGALVLEGHCTASMRTASIRGGASYGKHT